MNHKSKRQLIVILTLSCILLFEILSYIQKNHTISTFRYGPTTEFETKEELIVALFMNNIEADSSKFYDQYFPDGLDYIDYEYKIIDIKKEGEPLKIYVTIEGSPIVGAHISVGKDEITYSVNPSGTIMLENFNHKKSNEIPERLNIKMNKPYPEIKN